jgi:protease IV
MKEFFKYVLATVVGVFAVSIIGMVLFFMIIGAIISSTEKQVVVENNSMLVIDMSRQIVDRAPNDPFEDLDIPMFSQVKTLGLDDIFTSLENAATDDRIKGVYLKLSMVSGEWRRLKKSGMHL